MSGADSRLVQGRRTRPTADDGRRRGRDGNARAAWSDGGRADRHGGGGASRGRPADDARRGGTVLLAPGHDGPDGWTDADPTPRPGRQPTGAGPRTGVPVHGELPSRSELLGRHETPARGTPAGRGDTPARGRLPGRGETPARGTAAARGTLVGRGEARLTPPRWWRVAAAGLGWSSVSVVVAFWAANARDEGLTRVPDIIDAAGRLTGLLSADLLLLQVLTMSRIPMVERSYGQDRLVRLHRRLGTWSFLLLLAHIVLITVGYAAGNGMTVYAQFADLVLNESGMLLATAATGLLTLVVVTSIRVARKRLRYEAWHLLHLYAYLGIALAVPHQLALGGDFTASMPATVYWWTVYLAAVAATLIWRIGRPLYRMLRHRLVVEQVVPEGPGVVSVHIRGRNLDRLNAGAGQFFLWRFLSGKGWTRAHPYSLSAAPTGDLLRITVKDLGDDSSRTKYLRPGTRVIAEGPFGRLHSGFRTRRKVTLFAAGIGITPMRALLEELDYSPGDLTLIYRANQAQEVVLAGEIESLARERGARVLYLIGPRRRTRRGGSWLPDSAPTISDTAGLRQLVPDIHEHDVYLCGPDAWLDRVVHTLRRAAVPPANIHLERFSW